MIISDKANKHESIGNKPIGNKITKPLKFSGFVAFCRVELTVRLLLPLFLVLSLFSTSSLSLNSLTTASAIIHQKIVPLL